MSTSSQYYVDTIEDLERGTEENLTAQEVLSSFRAWRRQCRDFLAKPQEAGSLQEGYLLILSWLRIRGAPLSPADTTLEILNKSLTRMPESPFIQVT